MARCSMCGRKMPPLTFGKKLCVWCRQHEAQQRGELPEDATQPVMAAPWQQSPLSSGQWMTSALIAVNVLVFVVQMILGSGLFAADARVLLAMGANYGPLTVEGGWWRLLTYCFLHFNLMHLAMNMWCLWMLGEYAESLFGRWSYLALYLFSGVGGGLLSMKAHAAISAGASGAIFGVSGALVAALYLGEFNMPREYVGQVLRWIGLYVILGLFLGVFAGGVDYACHIGGLLVGGVCGALIARLAPQREHWPQRVFIFILLAALLGAGGWFVARAYADSESYAASPQGDDAAQLARTADSLQRRVSEQPDDAEAHQLLAEIRHRQGNLSAASEELRKAIDLRPKEHENYYNLGVVYLEQKNYKEALPILKKAAELDDDREIEEALAEAYRGLGDEAHAREALQKAGKI